MKHFNINLNSSFAAWLQIAILVLASFAPFMLSAQRVDAGTVTERTFEMETSEPSATGVTYTMDFQLTSDTETDLEGIVIQFCANDPIPGDACTATEGVDVPDMDFDNDGELDDDQVLTVELDDDGDYSDATDDTSNWSHDQVGGDADDAHNVLVIERATIDTNLEPWVRVTLDNVTNPSNTGTFYARILVETDGTAQSLTANFEDEGGVALSTANQITVTAKIQETLEFCVGTEAETAGDCSDLRGTAIDLGILDTTSPTYSTDKAGTASDGACFSDTGDDAPTPAQAECAILIVTTNATAGGVVIDYFAEAFDVGTACAAGTTASASEVDQCLNPINEGAEEAIADAEEGWGIGVINHQAHASSGTSSNLDNGTDDNVVSNPYDNDNGDGAVPGPADVSLGYAVNDDNTASTRLAGTENGAGAVDKVVDREQLEIEVVASPTFTTPSGSYQTTLTFVATGTF